MITAMNQEHFDLVKRSLPKSDIDKLFDERITLQSRLPPLQPLFRMFDTPCFFRGELVADCGKAKSGKTTFLSLLMACALKPQQLALERVSEEPVKVVWIDTEQSLQSTQEILKERVFSLTDPCPEAPPQKEEAQGVSSTFFDEHLYAFNLRGMGYDVRRKMVELAINTVQPDLAIIDGIKDLMTDINDAVQATLIMEQLMALAKAVNCCMVCVLHQNKSEADRNMRGSIGTELTNKAFEVFQCEYLERHQLFKVSQTLSRRQRIRQDLYYSLSADGRPVTCDVPEEQPRDALGRWVSTKAKSENLLKLFTDALEGRSQRPFNEVMACALKKCGVADAKTYYQLLAAAEERGIIRKMLHPVTRATWIALTDDGTLPF